MVDEHLNHGRDQDRVGDFVLLNSLAKCLCAMGITASISQRFALMVPTLQMSVSYLEPTQ